MLEDAEFARTAQFSWARLHGQGSLSTYHTVLSQRVAKSQRPPTRQRQGQRWLKTAAGAAYGLSLLCPWFVQKIVREQA